MLPKHHLVTFDSATPGTYNEAHLDRLQAFANQASIAIRNARLYEALQQQAVFRGLALSRSSSRMAFAELADTQCLL